MDAMKLSGQKQQIKLNLRDLDAAAPKPDGKNAKIRILPLSEKWQNFLPLNLETSNLYINVYLDELFEGNKFKGTKLEVNL